ncbi:MAG: zinc metallopeptidase [Lagierella massiliensis]|nr:zinc metallopeptidase [Lagierella massiliensis]
MYNNSFLGFYSGPWILIVFIAMIFGMITQARIKSTYAKYSKVSNFGKVTGMQAARKILDRNGLQYINIVAIKGELSDHYDPTKKTIRLSEQVYYGYSIADVSIAAHEVGHAIQHSKGYSFLTFRNSLIPLVNFASRSIYPLFIIGLFIAPFFIDIAIAVFAITVLFQIVTLPVELDASSRALNNLEEGILNRDEIYKGRKVLKAAAMTYVAAALFSIAQLLRLLSMQRSDD